MAVASPSKAVSALRTYQTEYPDYDAETWIASVRGVFHVKSVLTVALGLATLSDWSLRGIEISQDRLAKMTGVSKRSVTKAVARLTEAGFLSVSRRYPRSNGHEVTQKPDAYRLVIPGGPTWGVANTGLIGWDDEASYSVDTFSQESLAA